MLYVCNINDSYLCYHSEYTYYVNDYYQMIVELIKSFLNKESLKINITLCAHYNFNNNNKTVNININFEHTLLKQIDNVHHEHYPIGKVKEKDNDKFYLVKIENLNTLYQSDIIIDYSIPNIHNVKISEISGLYEFSKKHIYISSFIYDSIFIKDNRNIFTLTTFIYDKPRRTKILNEIKVKINHININNCFDKTNLQKLYKNTKILLNIHQTDDHHTFEELRVLPALQCGVIVICETSPLNEMIPYNDYIIWADYDNIVDKLIEVAHNYDYYYDLIFCQEHVKKVKLCDLGSMNYNTLSDAFKKMEIG